MYAAGLMTTLPATRRSEERIASSRLLVDHLVHMLWVCGLPVHRRYVQVILPCFFAQSAQDKMDDVAGFQAGEVELAMRAAWRRCESLQQSLLDLTAVPPASVSAVRAMKMEMCRQTDKLVLLETRADEGGPIDLLALLPVAIGSESPQPNEGQRVPDAWGRRAERESRAAITIALQMASHAEECMHSSSPSPLPRLLPSVLPPQHHSSSPCSAVPRIPTSQLAATGLLSSFSSTLVINDDDEDIQEEAGALMRHKRQRVEEGGSTLHITQTPPLIVVTDSETESEEL